MRVVYRDYTSDFRELLNKNNIFTIHERSIQSLAVELFKVKNNLSPKIMNGIFITNTSKKYNSRREFNSRNIHSVQFGIKSLTYLAPKIWSIIPEEIKSQDSIY